MYRVAIQMSETGSHLDLEYMCDPVLRLYKDLPSRDRQFNKKRYIVDVRLRLKPRSANEKCLCRLIKKINAYDLCALALTFSASRANRWLYQRGCRSRCSLPCHRSWTYTWATCVHWWICCTRKTSSSSCITPLGVPSHAASYLSSWELHNFWRGRWDDWTMNTTVCLSFFKKPIPKVMLTEL